MALKIPELILDAQQTFDTFVVGSSNKAAYELAREMTEENTSINALFIWGEKGVGKSHLLQAIANQIKTLFPSKKVCYLTAERFFLFCGQSIRNKESNSLYNTLNALDILLVDDIQYILNSSTICDVFKNVFNSFIENGKKIVFSANSPSEEFLKTVSFLQKGFSTTIYQPKYELRFRILQKQAQRLNLSIPDDVFGFLSEKITSNVQELKDVLKKISLKAYLQKKPLTLAMVSDIFVDEDSENTVLSPTEIGIKIITDIPKVDGKMTVDGYMIKYIRKLLNESFYSEGFNADYYLGKSPLNENLTLFFNAKKCNKRIICDTIYCVFNQMCEDNKLSVYSIKTTTDFSQSKFPFEGGIRKFTYTALNEEWTGTKYAYSINYIACGALEKLVMEHPHILDSFKKSVNDKETDNKIVLWNDENSIEEKAEEREFYEEPYTEEVEIKPQYSENITNNMNDDENHCFEDMDNYEEGELDNFGYDENMDENNNSDEDMNDDEKFWNW